MPSLQPVDVFISYSRKDARWLDQLMTHLKLLVREERVAAWCDRDIQAGQRWREEIDRALASARVGLFLVSPNFLASDFIMQDELPYLLKAAETRGVKLLWVLVTACLFDQTPLVGLQAAYNPTRPLAKLQGDQRNEALTAIAREILKAVDEARVSAEGPGVVDPNHADRFDDDPFEIESGRFSADHLRRVGGLRDGRDVCDDFLARVAEICRLRIPHVQLRRRQSEDGKLDYLHVTAREGPFTSQYPLAAYEHDLTPDDLQHFLDGIHRAYRETDPGVRSQIVCGGAMPDAEFIDRASTVGVWLRTFVEYQGLIDFSGYVRRQTERLEADVIYPPKLYIPQRFVQFVGAETRPGDNVLEQVFRWLADPDGRFVLVLGNFGTGKTFLLHELARQMPDRLPTLTPVLVEMRSLEKGHPLDVLVSMHMVAAGESRFDTAAFRYMLREGRVALLFDGFDELALRVTYERAAEHLETLVAAAEGRAKVIVTSRTSHFLSEAQAKKKLYEKVEAVAGKRLVQNEGFDHEQMQRFLTNYYVQRDGLDADRARQAADERMKRIRGIQELLGLSANPRMLSFIADLSHDDLLQADVATGKITSAQLYQQLLGRWLKGEVKRRAVTGGVRVLAEQHLWDAVTSLAMRIWQSGQRSVHVDELTDQIACEIRELRTLDMTAAEAAHQIGSGSLLVREQDQRFAFVHRSVMEWLVARRAAQQIQAGEVAEVLAAREMSPLMADFLTGLAGRDVADCWAIQTLAAASVTASDTGKANALLVQMRLARHRETAGDTRRGPQPVSDAIVQLAEQDLSGRDFSGQNLQRANLYNARLVEARLVGTDLRHANLMGAAMCRADLTDADLSGADLSGADLTGASLLGANLAGAKLDAAVFRRAKLIGLRGNGRTLLDAVGQDRLFGAAPPTTPCLLPYFPSSTSPCNTVALSPDGQLVASGHDDGAIRLWDTQTATEIRACQGHQGAVLSVAFSPDGATLASGADDKSVRLWDTQTATEIRACQGHQGAVQSVAFSPDGATLASGADDKSIRLWDTQTATEIRACQGHQAAVWSVAFSPDGATLASGADDKSVRLWDTQTATEIRACQGHQGAVLSVAFSPDGATLASGADDKSVRLWDTQTATEIRACQGHQAAVWSVAFSPDGATLASGADDKSVRLWDTQTATEIRACQGHQGAVLSVAFSPDGATLASGASDKSVRLWDTQTATEIRACQGHQGYVLSVAFSPDGATLASGASDNSVRLWDTQTATEIRACQGHQRAVRSVAFSPDGATLASGADDKSVRLWDTQTATEIRACQGHQRYVLSVAFSPDGATLASGADDKSVRLWDTQTATEIRACQGHQGAVRSVAFSPDGATLASGADDNSVRLWDPQTATEIRACQGHQGAVRSVAFSPDGATLASGAYDKSVRLWDTQTGRELRACTGHQGSVLSVAFSPDGATLASGADDKSVRLWDTQTATEIRACQGHQGYVLSVAFSPDGATLASASSDGTIRIWSVETGQWLVALLPLAEKGWAAVLPDGRYKLVGDPTGRFWHVANLCRFEPGELAPYVESCRPLPLDATIL
jgi:WD40 repeat protein